MDRNSNIGALGYRSPVADRRVAAANRQRLRIAVVYWSGSIFGMSGLLCITLYLIACWYYSTRSIPLGEASRDLRFLIDLEPESVELENAAIRMPGVYDDYPESRWYELRVKSGKASEVFSEIRRQSERVKGLVISSVSFQYTYDYLAPDWWFLDDQTETREFEVSWAGPDNSLISPRYEVFVIDSWRRILIRAMGRGRLIE